jgi:hypothetical protein
LFLSSLLAFCLPFIHICATFPANCILLD